MDRSEVTRIVLKAIGDLQDLSGAPSVELTPKTRPIDDLADFDSLRCLEAMILIEKEIGAKMTGDLNLFHSPDDGRALSVSESVDRLVRILGKSDRGQDE